MWRHSPDVSTDLGNCTRRSQIRRAQYADRVHQLLDSNAGVVGLSVSDQYFKKVGCPALHLVDVHAGIEQECLASDPIAADEREITVSPARQGLSRIKARPSQSRIKIKAGHLRSRVSHHGRFCLENP